MIDLRVRNNLDIFDTLTHGLTYTEDGQTVTVATDTEINTYLKGKFRFYDMLIPVKDEQVNMLQATANKWAYNAIEMFKTTQYEYNPIWNVDGTETRTNRSVYGHIIDSVDTTKTVRKQDTDAERSITYGRKDTAGGTDTTTNTYGRTDTHAQTVDSRMQRYDNGYDSSTAAASYNETGNAGTNTDTAGGSDTSSLQHGHTSTLSGTDTTIDSIGQISEQKSGGVKQTNSGNDQFNETITRQGNIGVTKTQDLIQSEREIILNVLDWYASKFADCFDISPYISNPKYFE